MQEAARKDVERAFGVLQARFAIVSLPCRLWTTEIMKIIMKAAIILHNMIIEDERDLSLFQEYETAPVTDYHTTAANRIAVERGVSMLEASSKGLRKFVTKHSTIS